MGSAALIFFGERTGQTISMHLQSLLATLHVPRRALLHFLPIVTGIFHVLFAESANHDLASVILTTLVANVMLGPGFLPLRYGT
jgi:hypothetical protein